MGRAIPWEELIRRHGPTHRLLVVLVVFLGYYLMLDHGQHRLECGWGHMLEKILQQPAQFGWGQCFLAHMYHEMHEIVYQEARSMAARVYILQVWAWEHLPVM